jgi:4-amino-4-deoxy-L-arabinose transferase-like glycosyltransferase
VSTALWVVIGLAFALRLVWALTTDTDPRQFFKFDATYFDHAARLLAAGKGFLGLTGQPTALGPPAYPFLLSIVYRVLGEGLLGAKLLNVFLGTLTTLITYVVCRRLYGQRIALLAGLLLAVFPGDIFYTSLTMSETSFNPVFVGALYLFVTWNNPKYQGSSGRWFAFGLCMGLACLFRGVALLLLPVPMVLWFAESGPSRTTLKKIFFTATGVFVMVLPWTIRNYRVMGHPILLSTDGALSLFDTHSPAAGLAGPGTMEKLMVLEKELFSDYESLPADQKEVAMSRAKMDYAIRYMLSHPIRELSLVPVRAAGLFLNDHWALDMSKNPRGGGRGQGVKLDVFGPSVDLLLARIADLYFYGLLLMALAGAYLAVRHPQKNGRILPFTFLMFVLIHGFLVWGSPRYHAPLAPIFAILASLAFFQIGKLLLGSRPSHP